MACGFESHHRYHLYFNEGGHVIRTLRFIVDGNTIKPDPSCDFTGLFPGREDSIKAEFIFSSDWDRTTKVAGFFSIMGREYEPQIIEDGACMIPTEAIKYTAFKIRVFGKKGYFNISTNECIVRQSGGNT